MSASNQNHHHQDKERCRVLVVIKDRLYSRQALHWYLENLAAQDDIVFVAYIVEPDVSKTAIAYGMFLNGLQSVDYEKLEHGKRICHNAVSIVRQRGLKAYHRISVGYHQGEAIANAVKQLTIDSVVMGESKNLKRLFRGRVSDYVQRHTNALINVVTHDRRHSLRSVPWSGKKHEKYKQLTEFD